MAAPGYIATLINSLEANMRSVLQTAFEYAMRENALGAGTKAENFSWFKVTTTTHATANTEFSVLHGMDHAPSKLIPILPLDSTRYQLTDLAVSRVSDSKRIYLKCASTGVQFVAYLE